MRDLIKRAQTQLAEQMVERMPQRLSMRAVQAVAGAALAVGLAHAPDAAAQYYPNTYPSAQDQQMQNSVRTATTRIGGELARRNGAYGVGGQGMEQVGRELGRGATGGAIYADVLRMGAASVIGGIVGAKHGPTSSKSTNAMIGAAVGMGVGYGVNKVLAPDEPQRPDPYGAQRTQRDPNFGGYGGGGGYGGRVDARQQAAGMAMQMGYDGKLARMLAQSNTQLEMPGTRSIEDSGNAKRGLAASGAAFQHAVDSYRSAAAEWNDASMLSGREGMDARTYASRNLRAAGSNLKETFLEAVRVSNAAASAGFDTTSFHRELAHAGRNLPDQGQRMNVRDLRAQFQPGYGR